MNADFSRHHDAVSLDKNVLFALVRRGLGRPLGGARGIRSARSIARGEVDVIRPAGPAARGLDLVDGLHEQGANWGDAADHENGPHLGPEKQVRSLIGRKVEWKELTTPIY